MGTGSSSEVAELAENLGDVEQQFRNQLKTNQVAVKRHGWDVKDKPECISVEDNNQKAILSTKGTGTGAVLGRKGYKQGIFLFEIEWIPDEQKNVVIGLATTDIAKYCPDRIPLIGSNEHSIGWHLLEHCIYHNGYQLKPYPDMSIHGETPNTITMILNMTEGHLAFICDGMDYGIAVDGIKELLGECVYVAASIDEPGDFIRLSYLGGLNHVKTMVTSMLECDSVEEVPQANLLHFHALAGRSIVLSNNNRTAGRENFNRHLVHATVFSNRTLEEGEVFAVRCDEIKWDFRQAWVLGVITVPPEEMVFPDQMVGSHQGDKWMYTTNKLSYQNKAEAIVNVDLEDLIIGDTIHVMKKNKSIHFGVNNEVLGIIPLDFEVDVYGFVDVCGRTAQVTLRTQEELDADTIDRRIGNTMTEKKQDSASTKDATIEEDNKIIKSLERIISNRIPNGR